MFRIYCKMALRLIIEMFAVVLMHVLSARSLTPKGKGDGNHSIYLAP
jgi:hypothetical protein